MARERDYPSEIVSVGAGLEVLSIRGGQSGSVLSIAGDPVQSESSDFSGSLGWLANRYVPWPRTGDTYLVSEWIEDVEWQGLRRWLAAPTAADGLAGPLAPLLSILEAGEYRLSLRPIPDPKVVAVAPDRRSGWYRGGWGPSFDFELMPTHRWPPPDAGTVAHFRKELIAGRRPALIVLAHSESGGDLWYLLDGHHKLAAYLERGLDPVCVEIVRQPPHEVRRTDVPRYWPDHNPPWPERDSLW
ncbi:hypothetical protein [Nocardia sp. NPDC048505]|uniref:hypothetical protein n=1 Tax=unclassified Nocardia TaxID=2637762 RepID=UPI0033CA776C